MASLFQGLLNGLVSGIEDAAVGRPDIDPRYQTDFLAWWTERWGMPDWTLMWSLVPEYGEHTWDGTQDPIATIFKAIAEGKDVGVESATGTGKTFLAAIIAYWFIDVFENAEVTLIAPREKQLRDNAWKEITRMFPRFKLLRPEAKLLDLELRVKPTEPKHAGWGIKGSGAQVKAGEESATSIQGSHAPHQLFLLEETPGIHPAILTAIENTMTGKHAMRLALGNPDSQSDSLHQFCLLPGTVHVRISALDHPNVVTDEERIPGAVTRESIARRRQRYGPGSRLYRSRIQGICPAEASDSLIKWEWCVAAAQRGEDPLIRHTFIQGDRALGVDVANSENGDKAALAEGKGAVLLSVDDFQCPDANLLASQRVYPLIQGGIQPLRVGVDSVGVGAGTVNEMKRLGKPIRPLGGGDSPIRIPNQEEEFNNLRSQMHWQLRMDLQHGLIILPHDEELFQDLTAIQWEPRNGKIVVQSKEKIKEILRRSPNKGDAVVYWNWIRQTRAGSTIGSSVVTL